MKFLLSIFALILSTHLALAGGVSTENHGCTYYSTDGGGIVQTMNQTASYSNGAMTAVSLELKEYYVNGTIYKMNAGKHQYIGNELKLPIPPFASFEEWQQKCLKDSLGRAEFCTQKQYQSALDGYLNSSRWKVPSYTIEDNPKDYPGYQVVTSDYEITKTLLGIPMSFTKKEGFHKVYKSDWVKVLVKNSVKDEFSPNGLDISNANPIYMKVTYKDNEASYIVRLDYSFDKKKETLFPTVIACDKEK